MQFWKSVNNCDHLVSNFIHQVSKKFGYSLIFFHFKCTKMKLLDYFFTAITYCFVNLTAIFSVMGNSV